MSDCAHKRGKAECFLFPMRDCENKPIFLVYAAHVMGFPRTEPQYMLFSLNINSK